MVYGYVNSDRGEKSDFPQEIKIDNIFYHTGKGFDFSFAKKGDMVLIHEFKSVSENLKELLEFSQYIIQGEIDIFLIDSKSDYNNAFIDTSTAIGKVVLNIMSALNEFDNDYFLGGQCVYQG